MMLSAIVVFVGVLLLAPVASAQGLFRSDALILYDSTGKKVGTPSQRGGDSDVVFRTGAGRTIILLVRTGVDAEGTPRPPHLTGTANLFFPESDCTGSPFLARPRGRREPHSHVRGPRQTVYVQAGEYGQRRMQSALLPDGRCVATDRTSAFAPAVLAGIDLADYFTPPFELRATAGEAVPTGAVAEALDPTDRLVVYDANGKKVGAPFRMSPAEAMVAVVTASGLTLLLNVSRSGFDGGAYFESTDCTGTPFILGWSVEREESNLVPTMTLVGPREAVHAPSGEATRRMMSSIQYGSGTCAIVRNRFGMVGETGLFAALEPIGLELADYFTPPFTVRAGRGTRALPTPD